MNERASGAAQILQNVERGSDLWVVVTALDRWGFSVAHTRISLWTVIVAIADVLKGVWRLFKQHGIEVPNPAVSLRDTPELRRLIEALRHDGQKSGKSQA